MTKSRFKIFILVLFISTCTPIAPCLGQPGLVIHAKTPFTFELQGYTGLDAIAIFHGTLAAGTSLNVATPYHGLAMLIFDGGQRYPIIIGSNPSDVVVTSPDEPPSFADGDENCLLYRFLSGEKPAETGSGFVGLMIQGQELLDASSSVQTVEELQKKKIEFQEFISSNYSDLSQSDLLGRLISQYFMMHEYVRYHRPGAAAGDIRSKYQQEILAGVQSLLMLLQDNIPENKLLNYIVGLYYNRGMVTFAAFIADNFTEFAQCGNEKPKVSVFPADLGLVHADGSAAGELGALKGAKMFSLVSLDCPVSMVMTVIKARQTADAKDPADKEYIIVVPLEKLSEKYRAMSRNVSGSTMLFVDDEKWYTMNPASNIRLPFFVSVAGSGI